MASKFDRRKPEVNADARQSAPFRGRMPSSKQMRSRNFSSRQKARKPVKAKAVTGAQNQLRRFRQASILAVAITGFLLVLLNPGEAGYMEGDSFQDSRQQQRELPDSVAIIDNVAVEELTQAAQEVEKEEEQDRGEITEATKNEALVAVRNLWESFYSNLPKLLVAIASLVIAWLLVRLIRAILKKAIKHWKSSGAVITLVSIAIWLLAIGIAVSVVAGDIRALVGSLGLVGLALSWSLQTPIESFTGWLMNSFRRYYQVGDRISVGEVFGDVYKIDFLTTTVWEIGAPYRQGFVQAEQSTGRLVTFPNNEILSGTVVNLTADFPYVWDELSVAVANESNIPECIKIVENVASLHLADYMKQPAEDYEKILRKAKLNYPVSGKPEVFISMSDSWTNIIIRYLVGTRERRKWKSDLSISLINELNKPEYKNIAIPVYPRQQLQFVDPDGVPVEMQQGEGPPQKDS